MADEFISLICSTLLEDGADRISDSILQDAFQESVRQLPAGPIRATLEDDLDSHFEKLKRVLSARQDTLVLSSSICVDAVMAGGLMTTLQAVKDISDLNEKQEMYEKLVLGSLKNSSNLQQVLEQWSSELHGAGFDPLLSAVKRCSRIACTPSSLLPWMAFCLKVYLLLLTAAGDNVSKLRLLDEAVCNCMMMAHVNFILDEGGRIRYDDLMAALASVVIDTCLNISSTQEKEAFISSSVFLNKILTLLGHSPVHLMDAVLQVSCPTTQYGAQLLLPLVQKALEYSRWLSPVTSLVFIKGVSCFQRLQALSSVTHLPSDNLEFRLAVPPDLTQWLWNVAPSVCESLSIQDNWSAKRVAQHLLNLLASHQADLLVKLITMASCPFSFGAKFDVSPPNSDANELFYNDCCGSQVSDQESDSSVIFREEEEVEKEKGEGIEELGMSMDVEISTGDTATMKVDLENSIFSTPNKGFTDDNVDSDIRDKSPTTTTVLLQTKRSRKSLDKRSTPTKKQRLLAKLARRSSMSPLVSPKLLRRSTRERKRT